MKNDMIFTARKSFGEKIALDVRDISLQKGKKYALIGANGSGKTTFLKCFSEMLDFEGEIADKGTAAYMPQSNFAFSLSAINNVLIKIPYKKRKENRGKAEQLLKNLGIDDLAKKNASKFSGGETQKIALARILLKDFDILLLDEPTSSMDVNSAISAEKEIMDYCNKNNSTLIFATHSMKQARRMADMVFFMKDGKILESGTPEEVLDNSEKVDTKDFLNFFNQ